MLFPDWAHLPPRPAGLALPSLTTVSSPNYVAEVLESIGLSDHFRSGQHVAWYSGEANNPAATEDLDAHPGVFVAAVAERLGEWLRASFAALAWAVVGLV